MLDPGRLLARAVQPVPPGRPPATVPAPPTGDPGGGWDTEDGAAGAAAADRAGGRAGGGDASGGAEGGPDPLRDGTDPRAWASDPPTSGAAALRLEELRGGWRVEAGVEEALALATVSGHVWASAELAARGGGEGMAPVVVVEAVERPGADHAVVTLLIGTLTDAGATSAGLVRLGVPVHLGPLGAVLAGDPWRLPPPPRALASREVASTPVTDTELLAAARRALDDVGIDSTRLITLEATDGWPFVARLDRSAPRTGDPWLRWHVDRFVVAGVPLHAAAVETHGAPGGREHERSQEP